MRALTFIEIDVPSFTVASPEATTTFRFTYPCDYLPTDIEAIPSLKSCSFTPASISLGKDLGTRASLACSFEDHRHILNGEPFIQGSFWGKWRARYGMKLQSLPLRWIQGLEGQALAEMETRHFVIESTNGPTPKAEYTITAKDILKLADGDRAQAPLPSNGFIVGDLSAVATSATLSPSGIGNAEYPASGYVAIGGAECMSFTRAGDVLTLTRGQLGTVAVAHDAGSRAQLILRYVGEDPADIIYDLLTTYAGIDPACIPLSSWQIETANYLQQNYSANIAEPTDVNKLVAELIEQAALVVWWEPLTQLIRLQVLRGIPTTAAVFDHDNTMEGTLAISEQPGTRLSQVFVYFGQRTPLEPMDQEKSFRSSVLNIDGDAEVDYRQSVIKKIYSRWIPFGARTVAIRLGDLLLGRFRDPPRRVQFSLFRHGAENPELGGGYRLKSWCIQDATGLPADAPIQITRLNPMSDRYDIEAEEMLFQNLDPGDLVNRVIIIDSAINNVNLRDLHDAIYPDPITGGSPAENLRCIIEANVIVGSNEPILRAFDVGNWPVGYPVSIEIYGRIQGAGGDGGEGMEGGEASGEAGGTAFYTRFGVDLTIFDGGEVWGGGGGGGGLFADTDPPISLGGGGGAGTSPGDGGAGSSGSGEAGTPEQGGAGAAGPLGKSGGDGGDPGEAGEAGSGHRRHQLRDTHRQQPDRHSRLGGKLMLTFTLDHAERACRDGAIAAGARFEPGKPYTLPEILAAGLHSDHVAWLIAERAKLDGSTVPLLQAWAKQCCRLQKVRGQKCGSIDECTEAIQTAMKAWAKGKATSKGSKEWAFSLLLDLINTGEF
jgi:hypothetical protein